MKHLYAVWVNYLPSSAPTNRMLAYLDAWSKMDINVTVVLVLPDRSFSRVNKSYSNIRFEYLWEKFPIKIRLFHYLLFGLFVKRFVQRLNANDHVFVYGLPSMLPELLKRNDILVFHEMTEHPSVIPLGVKLHTISMNAYLKCCQQLCGLFVISTNLRDFYIKNGVERAKIRIINMVVDPSRFIRLQKENTQDYIAYCGNASNNKDGVDQLIRAFSLISGRFQNLFLYIVGKAPNRKEEKNNYVLAEELGISNRVVFTGIIDYDNLPQILKNAKILALARPNSIQARYGFPTKLGEYLLSSNPVVITDTGDIPLFLKDKESAMIAEPDNVPQFAEKIEWLLTNTEEAQRIGKKGQQIAYEYFNANVEAEKIINCIFT